MNQIKSKNYNLHTFFSTLKLTNRQSGIHVIVILSDWVEKKNDENYQICTRFDLSKKILQVLLGVK